jgi:hypothetical protein
LRRSGPCNERPRASAGAAAGKHLKSIEAERITRRELFVDIAAPPTFWSGRRSAIWISAAGVRVPLTIDCTSAAAFVPMFETLPGRVAARHVTECERR